MRRGLLLVRLVVLAALLMSCGGTGSSSTASTTTTEVPTPVSVPTPVTTSPPESPTATATPDPDVLLLPSASEFGPGWSEILFIPYGPADDQLGTAPGGDGGGLDLGPEYGAQAPDGTWWFLDAAKRRLAHYGENGDYLGEQVLTDQQLVNGYFQYQLPRILDDGTLVAQRLGGERTTLLTFRDGQFGSVTVPTDFGLRYDDGVSLYGFSDDGGQLTRVDPATGDAEPVEWFQTRAGGRFRLEVRDGRLTIALPDSPGERQLSWRLAYAGDPAVPAYALVEAVSGQDGTIHLFVIGGTDAGVGGQLAGYLSISPDGVATDIEPTRNPFTSSDPGSPSHLGIRAGSTKPWLMIVDTDGVRVFGWS